jgi:hypothetical protein
MHIKTMIRYHHLILVRMAAVNKTKENKSWKGCGRKGKFVNHRVRMQIKTLENIMNIP